METQDQNRLEVDGVTTRVHAEAIVIDAQGVCVLLPGVHIPPPPVKGESFVDRALKAGLTCMNVTLGTGGIASGADDLRAFLNSVYGHLVYFELHPDQLLHVLVADDIVRAKREKKLGIIFGVQGLDSKIEGDLTLVRILHRLGLRVAQLTHNERNTLGCGCMESEDTGLTQLGKACVAELNQVGVLVDMAHGGQRTTREAIDVSSKPCVISHANARKLTDHPRNATDETIDALAASGGVIGISAYSPFCERERGRRPTLNDLVDHVAHVAERAGVDHVAIGSDFFEVESEVRYLSHNIHYPALRGGYSLENVYVDGFGKIDHWPKLAQALLRRGFSHDDVRKVLGDNLLRLFSEVWRN